MSGLRTERVTLRERTPGEATAYAQGVTATALADLIRERDAARAEAEAAKAECERLRKVVNDATRNRLFWHQQCALREKRLQESEARVAELDGAAAARPMGWIARHEQSPPVGKYVMCRWDVSARQGYAREVGYGVAKRGFDGMWRAPNGVEKIAPVHWMPLLPGVEGGDDWESPPPAAPAANAGGGSNQSSAGGVACGDHGKAEAQVAPSRSGSAVTDGRPAANAEPVAWALAWAVWGRGTICGVTVSREDASAMQRGFAFDTELLPLYNAPQTPRSWLTPAERACIEELLPYTFSGAQAKTLTMLLARSTPPRVKLPRYLHAHAFYGQVLRDVVAAIREAGGEVE